MRVKRSFHPTGTLEKIGAEFTADIPKEGLAMEKVRELSETMQKEFTQRAVISTKK